jgi:hypothetical protein
MTQPKKFSSMSSGRMPACSIAPLAAVDPNIGAVMFANCPINDPTGVLFAPTITTDLPGAASLDENALLA